MILFKLRMWLLVKIKKKHFQQMRLVKHDSYTYKDININRSIFIILIIHNYKWIKELTLNVIEEKLGNTRIHWPRKRA